MLYGNQKRYLVVELADSSASRDRILAEYRNPHNAEAAYTRLAANVQRGLRLKLVKLDVLSEEYRRLKAQNQLI